MAENIDVAKLNIQFTGDTDDLQANINEASGIVKKSFEKIKDAGGLVTNTFDKVRDFGSRAKQSFQELEISAQDVADAYGTLKERFNQGADLAELGAASLRVEDRFNKFSAAAGGADEIMAAFQRGVGGVAAEMDAMSVSAGLLQTGIVKDAESMERVTEIASRLGTQTIGVTDRISEFSQLLKNQSIEMLDNFGISGGRVRERIAELQAETAGLSREEAFLTATFEEADKALATLGPRTEDYLTAMERQQAAAADLEMEIGQKLAPAYSKLADFQGKMSAETAIAVKGFQTAFTTAVDLSGGIDKLAANFSTLATKMGTSSAALGGLGIAIGALVIANEALQQQLDEMNAAFDTAEQAGGKLGDKFAGLTSGSNEWNVALAETAAKLKNANAEFNNNIVTGTALGKVFNADKEFAETMSASLFSVNQALLAGSSSYDDYISSVEQLNSRLGDNQQKLVASTKLTFESTKKDVEAQKALEGLTAEQLRLKEAVDTYYSSLSSVEEKEAARLILMENVVTADEAAAEATRERMNVAGRQAEAEALATQTIRDQMLAVEDLTAAEMASFENKQNAADALEEINTRRFQEQQALAEAEAQQAAMAEKAARVADMQAESARRSAEALAEQRQAAIDLAVETTNLSMSLKDATEQDIARRFIGMLDPEKMGATAYTKAVTDIGLKSGLMDETSVRLATDMVTLSQAVNDNVIPMDDVSAAMDEMITNAETGGESINDLIDEFKRAPASINPVGDALQGAGDGMSLIASQGSEAALMIDSFGESTKTATPKLREFQNKLDATEANLLGLVGGSPWVVTVTADPISNAPGDGGGLPGGGPLFSPANNASFAGSGTNIEQMSVVIQVGSTEEVEGAFEGAMAWAGRSG